MLRDSPRGSREAVAYFPKITHIVIDREEGIKPILDTGETQQNKQITTLHVPILSSPRDGV